MDFRMPVADATERLLVQSPGASLANLNRSGCIRIPGGRRLQVSTEIPSMLVSLAGLLNAILAVPLGALGVIADHLVSPLLLGGLVVLVINQKVFSMILAAQLRRRSASLLASHAGLASRAVNLEHGKTRRKTKLLAEDTGVCLFDAARRRLLIEGCLFRYVICAADVRSVEPVSGFSLGGAQVICHIDGHELDLVIAATGHGAIDSLKQAFNPESLARGLAVEINRTLFGINQPQCRPIAPPPLPQSVHLP